MKQTHASDAEKSRPSAAVFSVQLYLQHVPHVGFVSSHWSVGSVLAGGSVVVVGASHSPHATGHASLPLAFLPSCLPLPFFLQPCFFFFFLVRAASQSQSCDGSFLYHVVESTHGAS